MTQKETIEWIPVTEELPAGEITCLVTTTIGGVFISTFNLADDNEFFIEGYTNLEVVAWAKLPKGYQPQAKSL